MKIHDTIIRNTNRIYTKQSITGFMCWGDNHLHHLCIPKQLRRNSRLQKPLVGKGQGCKSFLAVSECLHPSFNILRMTKSFSCATGRLDISHTDPTSLRHHEWRRSPRGCWAPKPRPFHLDVPRPQFLCWWNRRRATFKHNSWCSCNISRCMLYFKMILARPSYFVLACTSCLPIWTLTCKFKPCSGEHKDKASKPSVSKPRQNIGTTLPKTSQHKSTCLANIVILVMQCHRGLCSMTQGG